MCQVDGNRLARDYRRDVTSMLCLGLVSNHLSFHEVRVCFTFLLKSAVLFLGQLTLGHLILS